jgi:D-alanine-D-alanine ligase
VRIGLTYDLRDDWLAAGYSEEETAEFDRIETIDGLANALRALGHEPVRIGRLPALMERLLAGERWDLVFNIAEGMHGLARESQVPALLDAWQIPYVFSDALVLAVCLHKGVAKHIVRDAGVPTPDFAVIESAADIAGVGLPFPLFCKPVAEGTGKGVSLASRVNDRAQLVSVCVRLLDQFRQPVLVETYLPGREITVGILGTGGRARAIGAMEVFFGTGADPEFYTFDNKESDDGRVSSRLLDDALGREAMDVALAAWRALGCRDGGRVDLRTDAKGRPGFMEVNPLAGIHPVRSDLTILAGLAGIGHTELIGRILESALLRVRGSAAAERGEEAA